MIPRTLDPILPLSDLTLARDTTSILVMRMALNKSQSGNCKFASTLRCAHYGGTKVIFDMLIIMMKGAEKESLANSPVTGKPPKPH